MFARTALYASLTTGLAVVLAASAAHAEGRRVTAPRGGGLDAVEVTVSADARSLEVRRCASTDCAGATPHSIPIALPAPRVDLAHAVLEVIPVGDGRSVVHVRLPDVERKDLAFEALVAGHDDVPIFAGLTGYTDGADGDRNGDVILTYDRPDGADASAKFVLVAKVREDTRICGQAVTPLGARGIDPKTMQLRGATLHRLSSDARDLAKRVVAQARPKSAKAPLSRLFLATGGSAPGAQALTDGKSESIWSEQRPGDGHGEFVTMRAPSEVPIARIAVTVAPPSPKQEGAAPRTFFLATDTALFRVTMPEDAWRKPGASYEIAFSEPLRTTCVAVVLDEAYDRNLPAPEVSIAEVAAITRFDVDGASIDDVAKELAGARADEAAAVLRRSGDEGLAAVARQWATLDAGGRAFAVDVAASAGTCEGPSIELLARALADREAEVKKRAIGRLERCGRAAAETLARVVREGDEPTRAATAPLLATIAASAAVDPVGEQLGKGAPQTRRAMRTAFARASASAPRAKLLALLTNAELPPEARIDLLRATGGRLADLRPESDAAIATVLRASPDMATRYLLLQPLADLARAEGATEGELSRLAEIARRDPEWPVRMHAVELSTGIAPLAPTVVAAVSDPEPRVREAALRAIGAGHLPTGTNAAVHALAGDTWTFVRVAAADALGVSAVPDRSAAQSALGAALADSSTSVRAAAVNALGAVHATKYADKVRDRLDDTREDVEVRALSARALGAMCVRKDADRLTKLALLSEAPVDESDERLGMAAIEALAALHPPDLAKRLAPLTAKTMRTPVRRAAERAIAEPGSCR